MKRTLFALVLTVVVLIGDAQVRCSPAGSCASAAQCAGLRVSVEKSIHGPLPPAAIVVCNHQSLIALPDHLLRFVAKAELGARVPLAAVSLRYGRHAHRPRRPLCQTREALLRLSRQPGVSPVIFPEGTRSRDSRLGRFHSAPAGSCGARQGASGKWRPPVSFRGFLLDADNTIFDFDAAERDALLATVDAPAESLLREYRRINEALWKDVETGAMRLDQLSLERFRRLAGELALDADPEELSRRYLRELAARAPLLPGAAAALDSLSRRAVLGLLTNGIAVVQRSRIAVAGIEVFFQGIFVSEEIGVSKPDPAIFHLAARELHVAPYELLCVGDSPSSDIRGGHAAGMATCWVNLHGGPYPPGEPLPDYEVGGLEELLALAPPLS